MHFSLDNFLSCVDTINSMNYDYGNEILYRYCGIDCLPKPGDSPIDTKLSSAIWLIGKSYSADPTRSAPSGAFSNKGLGSSFEYIAKEISASDLYSDFYRDLQSLQGKKYCYQLRNDHDTLCKTVELVGMLNEMVTSAMNKAARSKSLSNTVSKNVVSFCSKFLHFMCPDLFFIIDSYSFNGGMALFSGHADRTLCIAEDGSPKNIPIDKSAREYFRQNYDPQPSTENDFSSAMKDYYKHCLRTYHLACVLSQKGKTCKLQIDGKPNSDYMPRLVDSIMMRIM